MSKRNKNDAGSGKKNTLVIFLLLLLVVGACGMAGYTFYEMNKMKKDDGAGEVKKVVVAVPMYIPLDTFTVSLKPVARQPDRVLYIGLTLRVKDDDAKALVEKFLPEIRSRLLMLFSQQTFDVLSTDEGKQHLTIKIKDAVNQTLAANHSAGVTDVLYNAFILR